jgi:MFS transporter, MFS domain-containing protein family, molybdate-anion transporter
MVAVFAISALSLSVPLFSSNGKLVFTVFSIFESMVGMFWPSVGMLRSKYIPENVRSTIMNYFRIPTNLFVMVVLGRVDSSQTQVFAICVLLLTICVIVQSYLAHYQLQIQKFEKSQMENEDQENVSNKI